MGTLAINKLNHRQDTWVTDGSDTFIEDVKVLTNNFVKWDLDLLFSLLKE